MKKSISVLIIFALILSAFAALVGCGRGDDADSEKLSVCVVVAGAFGDKAFNDFAKEGTEKLADERDVDVSYIECENEGIQQSLRDAADKADLVVAVGWRCYEIASVAPEYKDTKFIWVDNIAEGLDKIDNLLCITYAQNEGSFLAGYIAAKKSETGVIGVVGGEDSVTINDFIKGYTQGAKYADPDIKVKKIYSDTYEDPEKGKECALELYEEGADVIFNVAGNTGTGIFEAAQEKGFYAIGVDADEKLTHPEYDDVIICSMKKEVGNSIYEAIVDYMDNDTFEGGKEVVKDMASGHISIAYGDENSAQQISNSLKKKVEKLEKKIIDGDIEVKTTR